MHKSKIKSDPSLSRPLKTVQKILGFNLIKEIAGRIKLDKPISIVDIGSGVGRSLWELSKIFSKSNSDLTVTGIYLSGKPSKRSIFYNEEKRLEEVRKNPFLVAQEFNINSKNKVVPKLINTDACRRTPIKSNSVDIIYSTNAFHFFEDKLGALKEMSRILKINGVAIVNIDRTDGGFWPPNLFFPRLRAYEGKKIVSMKKILQEEAGRNFSVSISKVNSYGTGKDSYVLKIVKKSDSLFRFRDFIFDKKKSVSLNKIRYSRQDIKNIPEYAELIARGESFRKKSRQEYFGGYLSCYKTLNKVRI